MARRWSSHRPIRSTPSQLAISTDGHLTAQLPALCSLAEGPCDFPTLFKSRAERVVRLIDNPPQLRDNGFEIWSIHISNFVLSEATLAFCWLVRWIFEEADPKPPVIRLSVGLRSDRRPAYETILHSYISRLPLKAPATFLHCSNHERSVWCA